jgi:uncharacterized small protein (DUF1192 family)
MPDKANAAIPEDLLLEYTQAKAFARTDGWFGRLALHLVEIIERIAALTARAEQAEAKVARLSAPVTSAQAFYAIRGRYLELSDIAGSGMNLYDAIAQAVSEFIASRLAAKGAAMSQHDATRLH